MQINADDGTVQYVRQTEQPVQNSLTFDSTAGQDGQCICSVTDPDRQGLPDPEFLFLIQSRSALKGKNGKILR